MNDLVQIGSFPPLAFEIDPVCKMKVLPEKAAGRDEFQGKTYYFCATRCLERFRANPEQFLGIPQPSPTDSKSAGTYTCPMHPEVRRQGPGSCPKCGMALEPERITLDDAKNPELDDMSRRFRASASLSICVFTIAMSEMFRGTAGRNLLSIPTLHWIQFILSTPV